MTKIKKLIKSGAALLAIFALVLAGGIAPAEAATSWDVSGDYVINMNLDGDPTDYSHDWSLVQAGDDSLSGSGGSPAGANVYEYTLNPGGSVVDDTITFTANYTATADAVTPQTVLTVTGTIAEDGSMSGTWSDNYQGGARTGTWESIEGAAVSEAVVTTNPATAISSTDATLNGTNGDAAGIGHSFWASTSPFSTASPVLPPGVYSTPDMGPIAADTPFSASLSSVSGLPAITPGTTYYYAAWVNVLGTWYPGEVLSFETSPTLPETVKVTIVKYVDGELATAEATGGDSFAMNASWDAENIGAGSGNYSLGPTGFNNPDPYHATTSDMSSGADYSTSEVMNASVGASCDVDGVEYALGGYTSGNSLEAAADADLSDEAPAFTNLTSDKYVIVWNDDCSTPENAEGEIGGEVEGEGVLEVTSVETLDGSARANNSYEDGWRFLFHITVPTDETGLAMKFADWDGAGEDSFPAAGNMRISSEQADNDGATIPVSAADTYTSPDLDIVEDLDPEEDGLQIEVLVEVKIPSGTDSGSYTTTYGVRSQ